MKKMLLIALIALVAWGANMPLIAEAATTPAYGFKASKTTITAGEKITLSWDASGATRCVQSAYDLTNEWNFNKFPKDSVTLTPTTTTQFSLQCFYGQKSGAIAITKVTVNPAKNTPAQDGKPTMSFSVSPLTVQPGQGVTLSWSSGSADHCSALSWNTVGEWNGKKTTSGSQTLFPTNTTTYELRCFNGKGVSTSATQYTVNVVAPQNTTSSVVTPVVTTSAKPEVYLRASSTNVIAGSAAALSWSTANTQYCVASSSDNSSVWTGTKSTNGILNVTPRATTSYTLTCYNNAGSTSASSTVSVTSKVDTKPQMSFGASNYSIKRGEATNLSWNTANISSCTISANSATADGRWQYAAPTVGAMNVTPLSTTTYTLACASSSFSHPLTITVNVEQSQLCALDLPKGLLNRWTADSSMVDSVGGLRLTSNTLGYAAGKIGNAFSFNGINDYAVMPRTIGGDDFTVSMQVKTTQTGGTGQWWNGRGLIDGSVMDGQNGAWGISLVGDKAAFGISYNGDNTILSTTPINDGKWHQITVTRTKKTGEMHLYIDGALEAYTVHAPTVSLTAPDALMLGSQRSLSSPYGFFHGLIDEIQVYKTALTSQEVTNTYFGQCR